MILAIKIKKKKRLTDRPWIRDLSGLDKVSFGWSVPLKEGAGTFKLFQESHDCESILQSGENPDDEERYRKYESFLQRNRIPDSL